MVLHNHSWVNFWLHMCLHGRCTLMVLELTAPKVKEAAVSDRALLHRAPAKWSSVPCNGSNWAFPFCFTAGLYPSLVPAVLFGFYEVMYFYVLWLLLMETSCKTFDITEEQAFLSINLTFFTSNTSTVYHLENTHTHTLTLTRLPIDTLL